MHRLPDTQAASGQGAPEGGARARARRVPRESAEPSLANRSSPDRRLAGLLISHGVACAINNVYLEKSMCITVFDLVMNFKAKDSISSPPFYFIYFFISKR